MPYSVGAGVTATQVDGLSCTDFCLLVPTTCTCTVTGTILGWRVSANFTSVAGLLNLESDNLNMPTALYGLPTFGVLLTDNSYGSLTSMLNFTTLPEYQGYIIGCETTGKSLPPVTIHIPGTNRNLHFLIIFEAVNKCI